MENKAIVAVSGGPDSMYLLSKLREKNFELIIAHVNYNLRKESTKESDFLKDFCEKNNLKFNIKNINKDDWEKYSYLKNKQSMAREIRYDFFKEIAEMNNINVVYVGHHKDDFIETAIMQSNRSNDYFFYGIKEVSSYKGMTIKRPLLNIYKKNIIENLKKKKIKYMSDKTNDEPIYDRNKIRIELKGKTELEKDEIYLKYEKINERKFDFQNEFEIIYKEFEEKNFSWEYFNSVDTLFKTKIIYNFLLKSKNRININKNKLDSLVIFLENKKGDKKYRLMKNIFLMTKKGKIIILNKF